MQNSGRPKYLSKGVVKVLNENYDVDAPESGLQDLRPVLQILSIKGKQTTKFWSLHQNLSSVFDFFSEINFGLLKFWYRHQK